MNETTDFAQISLGFPLASFLCPRSQSTLPLVAVPLVSSHVWQFLSFSLSFMTLSFLNGTSQLPCRRSLNVNLWGFLMIKLSIFFTEKNSR